MTSIDLLSPRLRNHPDAHEFAEFLVSIAPDAIFQFEGIAAYAWEADIPHREEWDPDAEPFAAFASMVEDAARNDI